MQILRLIEFSDDDDTVLKQLTNSLTDGQHNLRSGMSIKVITLGTIPAQVQILTHLVNEKPLKPVLFVERLCVIHHQDGYVKTDMEVQKNESNIHSWPLPR